MSDNPSSRITGPTSAAPANTGALPRSYGDTAVVILPRDPFWFYAYWDVAASVLDATRTSVGSERFDAGRWALRVHDVTDIDFSGSNAHRSFDVFIDRAAGNWYINVGEANRSWCVDLGLSLADGTFVLLARSNILRMPRQGVSPITDEQWALLQVEFERLLKLSGVEQIGRSSFDVARLMRERWEEILSLSLPTSPGGASSWSSGFGGGEQEGRPKGFWLKADTEVIVYGATEPDAALTVQGRPVPLRPDGTFTLRFYLPDGVQEYPIEATSSDGTMQRRITFTVKRETR